MIISYVRGLKTRVPNGRREGGERGESPALAADTKDPQGRQNLLDLARAYDEAADRVQESLGQP
jgi:hypothetical protein